MNFPEAPVGVYYGSEPAIDTQRGYWGNGAHSSDLDWPFTRPTWFSQREQIKHGDRKTPLPYWRFGARVLKDEPVKYSLRGSDQNGAYYAQRAEHMSKWLVPEVWHYSYAPPGMGAQMENTKSKVVTELLGKIKDGKIQMGENIGQAVSTADMMAGPFITLIKAFSFARRGNWPAVKALLGPPRTYIDGKKIADGWLQYYYGWKPLISDCYALADLLKTKVGTETNYSEITKTGSIGREVKNFDSDPYYDADALWTYKVKAGVKLSVDSGVLLRLDLLGLTNPLALAWQLTPLSFVIDWFAPIGNMLEGLSAGFGLNFHSGYVTEISVVERRSRRNNEGWHSGWQLDSPGELVIASKTIQRSPMYSLPWPEIHIRDNPFNTERALSATALWRNLQKGLI